MSQQQRSRFFHSASRRARPSLVAAPIQRVLVAPDRRPRRFVGRLESGEVIVDDTRQPLVDSARALIARGFYPATPLTMRMVGKAYDSFRPAPISEWARRTYIEGDKRGLQCRRWMPFPANLSEQGTIPAGQVPVRPIQTELALGAPPVRCTARRPAGAR